jgi:hypothetical protein
MLAIPSPVVTEPQSVTAVAGSRQTWFWMNPSFSTPMWTWLATASARVDFPPPVAAMLMTPRLRLAAVPMTGGRTTCGAVCASTRASVLTRNASGDTRMVHAMRKIFRNSSREVNRSRTGPSGSVSAVMVSAMCYTGLAFAKSI